MKRLFSLLLTFLLVWTLSVSASADVLWKPPNDKFYDDETADTIARIYVVPQNLTVNLYSSPDAAKPDKVLSSGTRVYVGFSQQFHGECWGVGYVLGDFTEGWFRLGRLQREYDNEQFQADFRDQLSYDVPVYQVNTLTGDVPTWTYPGSGIQDQTIPYSPSGTDYNDGQLTFRCVYTDPNGGQWGYVGYYMGRCGWVYLTDLYTTDAPSFPQIPKNTVTDTSPTEAAPGTSVISKLLILLLALVCVTSAMIFAVKKSGKIASHRTCATT